MSFVEAQVLHEIIIASLRYSGSHAGLRRCKAARIVACFNFRSRKHACERKIGSGAQLMSHPSFLISPVSFHRSRGSGGRGRRDVVSWTQSEHLETADLVSMSPQTYSTNILFHCILVLDDRPSTDANAEADLSAANVFQRQSSSLPLSFGCPTDRCQRRSQCCKCTPPTFCFTAS